ncbi:MAG: hypothetical protein EU547_03265 [Promethearchaeota archaeon]|nr:MAG: hypothetical protein EU547_03265 [Candidatus Lokiarchaeota archaeon]
MAKKVIYRFVLIFFIIFSLTCPALYYYILENIPVNNSNQDQNLRTSDIPIIIVNSPSNYSLFGNTSTDYSITINGDSLNYSWYEFIETGEKSDYTSLDGVSTIEINDNFDQDLWDNLPNGSIHIRFYANNSLGELGYNDTVIWVDSIVPDIEVITPTTGFFNSTPPDFIIEISEPNLNKTWYTLNTNSTKHFFQTNDSIDYNAWNYEIDGSVYINFFANDTVGNEDSKTVQITKDILDPEIMISLPVTGYYNSSALEYSVEISDDNLDKMWYIITGDPVKYFFTDNGTLTGWSGLTDGVVTITFFANDSAGNEFSDFVVVTKDASTPSINIISPIDGYFFNATTPSFNVEITDDNLDKMWYILTGDTTKYFFTDNETLTGWEGLSDGVVTITFFANDSAGNEFSDSVTVKKDSTPPTINIISPTDGQFFNATIPSFNVEITDDNLDKMWYTLSGDTTKYSFTDNGTLTGWDALSDGAVAITFYANDSAGNKFSDSLTVTKDSIPPNLNIVSPTDGQFFNATTPSFNVEITDDNLDKMWYILTGDPVKYFFTDNGTLTGWSGLSDGAVAITFYANDSAGNEFSDSLAVTKDSNPPTINIVSPADGQFFNATIPSFNVEITDDNLDKMWYTLSGDTTKYFFTENGTLTGWEGLLEGAVTITFFANDSAGNEFYDSLTVTKDSTPPNLNIISPVDGQFFNATTPSFNVEIIDDNLDKMWFILPGDMTKYYFTDNGTLTGWEGLSDGQITITFFANDSAGNEFSDSVTVNKDTFLPLIDIIFPIGVEFFNATTPSFNVEIIDDNLDKMWYTFNFDSTKLFFTDNGTLTGWSGLSDGEVTITFFANDSAGNEFSDYVVVNKDTLIPSINIISPIDGQFFNDSTPNFNVRISDANLDKMWYIISGDPSIYYFTDNGTLNGWFGLSDGEVTITFFANDSAGNEFSDSIIITKDSTPPAINIILPIDGQFFNATTPSFNVEITDNNLDKMWYIFTGDPVKYFFTDNGTLTGWEGLSDGEVTITFFANDSAGNEFLNSIAVTKDTIAPEIYDSQLGDELWRNNAGILYDVDFYDSPPSSNLDFAQYIITNDTDLEGTILKDWTYIFIDLGLNSYSLNWSIDFNACQEGYNYISVRVYDKASNFATLNDVFYVKKDTKGPTIIDSQIGDDIWRDSAGTTYNVDFYDSLPSSNLRFAQYKITSAVEQGGTVLKDWTYIFSDLGSTSYTTNWEIDFAACKEGINYISVLVYDDAGNLQLLNDVFYVKKDTTAPILVINNPTNNTYYNSEPPINVTVFELNLDFLSYSIDGYPPYINLLNNNSEYQLNPNIWDDLPEGKFDLLFTCYDDLGNYSELKFTLYKDTMAPTVNINTPANHSYWNSAPYLNVTTFDPNFDSIWYSVNNINITIVNNTQQQLDSLIWNSLPIEGEFQLKIFANDSFGYINDSYVVTLYKDVLEPRVNILSPLNYTFWKFSPSIQVTVEDPNFERLWYRVGANQRFLINNSLIQLDLSIWNELSDECEFIIYIYANDTAGNVNDINQININKDILGPRIIINSPNFDDLFGEIPPNYDISIDEPNLNQTWYTLIGGSINFTFIEWSGTIDESIWEELEGDTITIRFYANDTLNNLGISDVTVRKNLDVPIITITDPGENDLFGINAPNFEIYKSGYELNTTWYTLDNGMTNYTFTGTTGIINQAAWDVFDYEFVTIHFYINDSLGRIGYDSVIVRKDPDPPIVSINFIDPTSNNSYCANEPTFKVLVYEPNLDSIWYQVGGIFVSISNNTEITLSSTIWYSLSQGNFVIEVFANDTLGYINDPVILTFKKDTVAPYLIINEPLEYYYNAPPPINVTVIDPNFHYMIYTVLGYSPISLNNETDVLLEQSIWDDLPEGEFFIQITARDTFGHENNSVVLSLYKDTLGPVIDNVLPESMTYYNSPPILKVSFFDPNLHSIWYKIGMEYRELQNNTEQFFDSLIWDNLDEGEFTLEFFANDTFGENSSSVYLTLIKDIISPRVIVNWPTTNNTYHSSEPTLSISAFDLNLDKVWYQVNDNINFLTGGTVLLDEAVWDELAQGEFHIYLFANDSAGNLNDSLMLILYKDTIAPVLVVNAPYNNTYYSNYDFFLNTIAYDINPTNIFYKVAGYSISIENNTDEIFNYIIWRDYLSEGLFTIEFYAIDSVGNRNTSINYTLYKDTIDPVINIISPLQNDLYGTHAPNFEISIMDNNLNTTWYSLVGNSSIFIFTSTMGSIDQTTWDFFENGTVTIRFYANDTAGNNIYEDVTVRKNIFAPIITIISPENDNRFGIHAPSFTIYKSGVEIQTTWYTLDNGATNYTFSGLTGVINQDAWDTFLSESISIRFYVNDTFGKVGYDDVIIIKDQDAPIININTPSNQTAFANTPFVNLTILEPSLDKVWYVINGIIIDITLNFTQFIDSGIWDSLPQGSFIINLFANDTVGNVNNFTKLILSKDTYGPNITVISPTENQHIGKDAPYFELAILDANDIVDNWYTVNGGNSSIHFIGTIGKIDQTLWESIWDNLTQGETITIRFYSRDVLGNVNYTDLTVIKDIIPVIPIFFSEPIGFLASTIALVALVPFTFKLHKSRYYKSLNEKEKKKLGKLIVSMFFFVTLLVLFYVF